MRCYLGFDLGASSGRAMLGFFEDGRLRLEELHRFPNDPVMVCGRYVWDLPRLLLEIKRAIAMLPKRGVEVVSMGIDTWGVDFGLLDRNGQLCGLPLHYRDPRNGQASMEAVWERIPQQELFARTGNCFRPFNSIYQLYAMRQAGDTVLERADRLLFMPDLLAYCLTGCMGTDYTVATTSQLFDARTGQWCTDLFERLDLGPSLMGPVVQPGTLRGRLTEEIAEECGVGRIPVVSVAAHDTASAVAAVPAEEEPFAYLSSGTISLLGTIVDAPMRGREVMDADYANEGAADGRIRLLANIAGLWILQECRREWARRGQELDFAELAAQAEHEPPFRSVIDVQDMCFYAAGDMPGRIREYCRATGQEEPQSPAAITRVICEGLALRYRQAMRNLERQVLKKRLPILHVVGGGSHNRLLNQMTADAIEHPVVAGPGEATVTGNLLVQAVAAGDIPDLRQARRVVLDSFETERFEPGNSRAWAEAEARLERIIAERNTVGQ